MKDKIAEWLVNLLKDIGLDPIYFCTVVALLLCLFYRREFKNWRNVPFANKLLTISGIFGTIVLVIISLFRILGIIKLE